MGTSFNESRLEFCFDGSWTHVQKYDDGAFYRKQCAKLSGTTAVDFVGMHEGRVWLIEVKNLTGYTVENRERVLKGELWQQVAQNFRDTVAALVGAHVSDGSVDGRAEMIQALARAPAVRPLVLALWLEPADAGLPDRRLPDRRSPVRSSTFQQALKRQIAWLSPDVRVVSIACSGIPGVEVRRLPDNL